MPTKWFLLLVLIGVVAAGALSARRPRPTDGPPPRPQETDSRPFSPAGTPASGRFRFVDLTGQPAPEFTLTDLDGRAHTLSDHRGKVVMLIFWATWCKTCPVELPHLGYIAHAVDPGKMVTLSINWEKDPAAVRKMARETRLDVPVLRDADQKVRYDYDVWSLPRVVLVDRSGKVARVIRGYEGEAGPIVKALAEQGISIPGLDAVVRPVPIERVPKPSRP